MGQRIKGPAANPNDQSSVPESIWGARAHTLNKCNKKNFNEKLFNMLGMVTHTCNPSTQVAAAGGSRTQGYSWLISEFQAS